VINRCNEANQKQNGRKKCHKKGDIDEFIKEVTVEIWSQQLTIDFLDSGQNPTYLTKTMQKQQLLDPNRYLNN